MSSCEVTAHAFGSCGCAQRRKRTIVAYRDAAPQQRGPGDMQGGANGAQPGQGPQNRNNNNANTQELRVNRRIRVREVRVIGPDGTQLGILPTEEALRKAEELNLDLVEVSPMARPPVCKIMDHGKFKYQQKRNANEAKKKQKVIEVKEVKFRPKTDKHDFEVKVNQLKRFLSDGDKGRVTIMFRGREIVHPEIGHDILRRVAEAIADIAVIEVPPRMEGKQLFMVAAPGKPAAKKKEGAEGAAPAAAATTTAAPTGAPVAAAPAATTPSFNGIKIPQAVAAQAAPASSESAVTPAGGPTPANNRRPAR